MSNMEITFFRALREAKISDELAQAAVENLEEFITMKIKESNRSLELKVNLLLAINTIAMAIGGYVAMIAK